MNFFFPHSDSRCWCYVSDLSSFTPRYIDIWVKIRHFPSSVKLSLRHASFFLRLKAADSIFDQLSFSRQVWRYVASVTRSWLRAPSTACQSPAEYINARLSAYSYFCKRLMSAGCRCRCYIGGGPRLVPVECCF